MYQNSDNESSSKSIRDSYQRFQQILCVLFTLRHHSPGTEKKVAIWKSRHWQLDIGIGISICIGIAKILVLAYELFFEKVEHLCPRCA